MKDAPREGPRREEGPTPWISLRLELPLLDLGCKSAPEVQLLLRVSRDTSVGLPASPIGEESSAGRLLWRSCPACMRVRLVLIQEGDTGVILLIAQRGLRLAVPPISLMGESPTRLGGHDVIEGYLGKTCHRPATNPPQPLDRCSPPSTVSLPS